MIVICYGFGNDRIHYCHNQKDRVEGMSGYERKEWVWEENVGMGEERVGVRGGGKVSRWELCESVINAEGILHLVSDITTQCLMGKEAEYFT